MNKIDKAKGQSVLGSDGTIVIVNFGGRDPESLEYWGLKKGCRSLSLGQLSAYGLQGRDTTPAPIFTKGTC